MAVNAASNAPGCSPHWPTPTAAARRSCTSTPWWKLRPAHHRAHEFLAMAAFHATGTARWTSSQASAGTWRCCGASPNRCWNGRRRSLGHRRAVHRALHRELQTYRKTVEEASWEELTLSPGCRRRTSATWPDRYWPPTGRSSRGALGWTQQEHGCDTVREILNLLMLRGNLGRRAPGRRRSAATATCRAPHLRDRPPLPPRSGWPRLDAGVRHPAPREHGLDT